MALFSTTRRVEFRDTDAAGILHFASFFALMESVEHEFLRQLGLSLFMPDPAGPISWPRVHVHCDYRSAARFDDVLDISLSVARLGKKSVTYQFDIRHDAAPVADGQITAVCCRMPPGRPLESISIPAHIAEKLRPYLAS